MPYSLVSGTNILEGEDGTETEERAAPTNPGSFSKFLSNSLIFIDFS